jgi:hypothetical protein
MNLPNKYTPIQGGIRQIKVTKTKWEIRQFHRKDSAKWSCDTQGSGGYLLS